LAAAVQGLERRLYRAPAAPADARPANRWPALVPQIVSIVVFALLLEFAVLGTLSVRGHVPRLPPDIVRAARDLHLPFAVLRSTNSWLITLTTLGYFGLASLLFWRRSSSGMARFTASVLFLFGGGLFNTGARYYAGLVHDLTALRAVFHLAQVVGVSALLALLYLFPNGRLAPAWTRPAAVAWAVFALAWLLLPLAEYLTLTVIAAFFVSGLLAQLQRYRAALPEEQRQLRWPLAGFAVAIFGFGLVSLGVLLAPGLRLPNAEGLGVAAAFGIYMLPWLFIPATIGYAARRHRLWAT
jgi:hypothetical protein